MEKHIRAEFDLSVVEYNCLLRTLQARFGVRGIEDVAFLSVEQLVGVTDRFEAAAVKRLFEIATTNIGVEKLYRSREISRDLVAPKTKRGESDKRVFITTDTYNAGRARNAQASVRRRHDGIVTENLHIFSQRLDMGVASGGQVQSPHVRHSTEHEHQSGRAEIGVAQVDHGQVLEKRDHACERVDVVGREVVVQEQGRDLRTVRKCMGDTGQTESLESVAGHIEVLELGQLCEYRREVLCANVAEEIGGQDESLDASAAGDRRREHLEACVLNGVPAEVEVLKTRALWQDLRERLEASALQATVDEAEGGHETDV